MTEHCRGLPEYGSRPLRGPPGRRDASALFALWHADLPALQRAHAGRHALSRLRGDALRRRGESRQNTRRRRRRVRGGNGVGIAWGFFPEWQFYWALLLGFGAVETMVRFLTKRQGLDLQVIAIAIVVFGIVLSRVVLAQRARGESGRDRTTFAPWCSERSTCGRCRTCSSRCCRSSSPGSDSADVAIRFVGTGDCAGHRWPANTSPSRLASAQISRIGAPLARLNRRQSSYSGMAPMTRPSQPRSLSRTSPQRVVTTSNRRGARVRLMGVARTPMVVLSTNSARSTASRRSAVTMAETIVAGSSLLHRYGCEPDVERARGEETLAQRFVELRVHVVDVRFQQELLTLAGTGGRRLADPEPQRVRPGKLARAKAIAEAIGDEGRHLP